MSVTIENASVHLKRIGYGNTFASNVILVREALERGITVSKSERFNDIQLEFHGRVHRWRGGRNTLNGALAKRVTRYRDVTSALLRSQGINAAENIVVDPNQADRAWAWAAALEATIFKSNTKRIGAGSHVAMTDEPAFRSRFNLLFNSHDAPVLLEKFYRGHSHRFFVVNGTIIAAAYLRPTSVVGNGSSTISELIIEKNRKRRDYPAHRKIDLDARARSFLSSQALSPDAVPTDGERVYLAPVSSPRGGGDAIDVTASLTSAQTNFVQSAVGVIPGLTVAGVDVMFDTEGEPDGLVLLEVNADPHITIYHHPWKGEARDVASAVLDAMFPDS